MIEAAFKMKYLKSQILHVNLDVVTWNFRRLPSELGSELEHALVALCGVNAFVMLQEVPQWDGNTSLQRWKVFSQSWKVSSHW